MLHVGVASGKQFMAKLFATKENADRSVRPVPGKRLEPHSG
jgi:hypothetical protein